MFPVHFTSQPPDGDSPSQMSVDFLYIYLRFYLPFLIAYRSIPLQLNQKIQSKEEGVLC